MVWTSIMFAGMGSQMETLVVAWLVLTTTDSPFLVGLISSVRLATNFIALFAGAVADRLRRQLVLAAVEFTLASLAVLMLALVFTGRLEMWHLFTITFFVGLARIFQMPAAQSLAIDSVAPEQINIAVALTTMSQNMNLVIGPLLGGILFELFGAQGAYALIALLYASSGISALFVRTSRVTRTQQMESVIAAVIQALRYVKGQQLIWAALVIAVIINLTGFPFHGTLVPIFARDVLGLDAAGLGVLISAFGIGAVAGSMFLSFFPELKNVGKLLILSVVVWHGSMAAFGASTSFPVSLAILVVTGFAFSSTLVLIMIPIWRTALPEYRGRIIGLRVLAIYASAIGNLNSGGLAGAFSPALAANVSAGVGIVLAGILALVAPKLRRA
ncbi:MAG: MFS transporter [Chloroflexi bacterium]|nr:MFS transporter [Chloroflexota bacterium]